MINQLIIKGFKSFVDKSINFNQLNVLTGLNSSGKSTVIQALQILNKYSRHFENPLIEGHGDYKELQNPFSSLPFSINAKYGEHGIICYSPQKENNIHTEEFPDLIIISADRYGPLVSIPLLSDCELGSKGENVIKCIQVHENDILGKLITHPNSEGDTFLYNLRAWLGTITPGVQFNYDIIDKADTSFSLFNGYRAKNVGFGLSYTLPIIVALFLGTIKKNTFVINKSVASLPWNFIELVNSSSENTSSTRTSKSIGYLVKNEYNFLRCSLYLSFSAILKLSIRDFKVLPQIKIVEG